MTCNKLYDLFCLVNDKKYFEVFIEFKKELCKLLPNNLITLLSDSYDSNKDKKIIENFYLEDMEKINVEDNLILLSSFDNLELKVGLGALTSTQSKTPSEILSGWKDEAIKKSKGITERVLGYGHDSISEQARTTFGMMCSMVTYHQQIRHRLSENYREDICNIITDTKRTVLVPKSIKESIFYNEYLDLVEEFKKLRLYILEKYGEDRAFSFILNCDQIKLIISTNARMDVKILEERICMNAQWEIRELATKKLMVLRKMSDILFEKALPTCIYGACKEGKLSCGKQKEMKNKFL
jgi:thymidylate synthase ThyX